MCNDLFFHVLEHDRQHGEHKPLMAMWQGGIHPLPSRGGPQPGHHREGLAGPGRVGVRRDRTGRALLSEPPAWQRRLCMCLPHASDMRMFALGGSRILC